MLPFIFTCLLSTMANVVFGQTSAVAVIAPDVNTTIGKTVTGKVTFSQASATAKISIQVTISGLAPNSIHGMHVHASPVLNQNCTTAGAHFNPLNATHGGPTNNATTRHYGDLGNFQSDATGAVSTVITDSLLSFFGEHPITDGKLSFMVHEKQDDLGAGNSTTDTLKTGNAGSKLACGTIVMAAGTSSLTPGTNGTSPTPAAGSTAGTGSTGASSGVTITISSGRSPRCNARRRNRALAKSKSN